MSYRPICRFQVRTLLREGQVMRVRMLTQATLQRVQDTMRALTITALLAGAVVGLVGCGASLDDQVGAGLASTASTPGEATDIASSAKQATTATDPNFKQTSTTATASGSAKEPKTSTDPASDTKQLKAAADSLMSGSTPGNSAYKIGPLDVLEVAVFKVKDLESKVQVSEAGTINLPLVGEIPAAGRTAQQIERDLEARLGAKYLRSPQVTVYVKEYNSQRLTVEGAVKKPGVYPLKGKTTLLQCIAMAEGQATETASSTVIVFRQTGGERSVARFDVDDIRGGKAEDPIMRQGDVIVVDTSTAKVAFNNIVKVLPVATLFKPF